MTNYRLLAIFVISCWFLSTALASLLSDTIKLRCYFRNNSYIEVTATQAAQLVPYFDLQKNTLIHSHGYTESTDTPEAAALLNSYVAGTDYNVIGVDYRYVSHTDYFTAVLLSDSVATVIAQSINDMVAAGMDKTKIIASGFSLGAQICALIGRKLPFVLPQIIGIDPAGPLFNYTSPSLTASDALCVICIHTDMNQFGTGQLCNHIDFIPNAGVREQPGCSPLLINYPADSCSHFRSEIYMTEEENNPNTFIGVNCNNWDAFKTGNYNATATLTMGINTPCSAVGTYCLQTNSAPPFAKGSTGTVYQP